MRNIVIVDAISTGKNYVPDILKRNYHPVVLEPRFGKGAEQSLIDARHSIRKKYAGKADFLDEKDTYEETLAAIRAYDPLLVLPGSEFGVELAIRLSDSLGLLGNPYANIDKYIHKDAMHEALKAYGIRYIRGKIVRSVEEAVAYYRESDFRHGCVIKPVRGAGTVGVHLCDDEAEMVRALETEIAEGNSVFGIDSAILLQERIVGEEYIVNTVSRDGKHRLSSILHYKKKKVEGGGNVYDYGETLGRLSAGYTRMVRYAFDVADAIGYQNGAIHGEYMLDEDGPVLIEVNCRVMGASFPDVFLDRIFGHHETDNVLDSLLDPAWHESRMRTPYRTYAKGYCKTFINPKDQSVELAPVIGMLRHLPSFHGAGISAPLSGKLARTVDLETNGGMVYLVHEDESVVDRDVDFLCKVEQEYHDMLFTARKPDPADRPARLAGIPEILRDCGCSRSILILTNDPNLNVQATVVQTDGDRDAVSGNYNWGILDYDYRSDEDVERMVDDFYFLVSKVGKGGHIILPERTYWHFPCGVESMEILCESAGLRIEAPNAFTGNVVIATVEN